MIKILNIQNILNEYNEIMINDKKDNADKPKL